MANSGNKYDEQHQNFIVGNTWFSSVKTAKADDESGHEWIGLVKTLKSLFLKEHLKRSQSINQME
jgi:hypothetical protein